MPEAFKEKFNSTAVNDLAAQLKRAWPEFEADAFAEQIIALLPELELKQRSDEIKQALRQYLPDDFEHSADIIVNSLAGKAQLGWQQSDSEGVSGWMIMPLADYVADYGHEHFERSMVLLKQMTSRFSSEFAIRPFIQHQPARTFAVLASWVNDDDEHVRRLVSEGTRPRLPWGIRLQALVRDPSASLPLLQQLKDDPSEYVRRSVANHLNDIAKDHPDLVADIAMNWMKDADVQRRRLLRHACRTLIKQGHKPTLAVFGYGPVKVQSLNFAVSQDEISLGQSLQLQASFKVAREQPLIIDYAIHHPRANGSVSAKVFKGRTLTAAAGEEVQFSKSHAIKAITTRRYYPGWHQVDLLINGECVASSGFELLATEECYLG